MHRDAVGPARGLGQREPAGEALELRAPKGRDARCAADLRKERIGDRDQLALDIGRQIMRMAEREEMQRLVHDVAAQPRIGLGAERIEWVELEDVAGEDVVRIGEHALDAAHAQLARPRLDRRAGRGPLGRIELGHEVAHLRPVDERQRRIERGAQPRRIDQREQPLQPARGDRGHAVHFQRAGEIDGRRAEPLREIVGGKPVAPLGRRQAELLAHRPAEPGARLLRLRPRALIEAAQDHHVGLLQPRFERAPDEEAGMGEPARTHHLAREQAAEEGRVIAGLELQHAPLNHELGEEERERLARIALPQPGGGARAVAGERLGTGDMGLGELRRAGRGSGAEQRHERGEGAFEIGDQRGGCFDLARRGAPPPLLARRLERGGDAAQPLAHIDAAKRRKLERACRASDCTGRAAEKRERMLQAAP